MTTSKRKMSVPEIDLQEWEWPDFDTKLIQVFDQVKDIYRILPFVDNRAVCIQAGGACGVWPKLFSKYFVRVITFEPEPENYQCLLENCPEKNITKCKRALGDEMKAVGLALHKSELTNAGAWYVHHGDGFSMVTIDSMGMDNVGLIQLDIEGLELEALKGARETIMASLPLIVIEEKKLPQFTRPPGLASAWLAAEFGYKVVGHIHRDVILKC